MNLEKSIFSYQQSLKYIPGGVNSPVRAFQSVGGNPVFIQSAKGAYLYDVDNNSYIDYVNSWGPAILGHLPEVVVEAVTSQLQRGFSFGTPTEIETELAKLIVENVPHIEQIRMVNSGTEACMSAIRLARGYTQKNKFIKFEGCYHGHADAFLVQAGSGAATFGNPSSAGVPPNTVQDTLVAEYNNIESVQNLLNAYPDDIAAIILEPIAGNMGCIPPEKNFLQELRTLCNQHKVLLIFDEVMTGFRVDFGGAQALYNIKADIVCFGKIIGGGLPVGAFAATQEIMNHLAPQGKVYQAGTLSGNPMAMQAGLATLRFLRDNPLVYEKINETTTILEKEVSDIFNKKGIPFQINHKNAMFSVFFSEKPVHNFKEASESNHARFNQFFHALLEQGVYLPPSSYETWFISNAIESLELEKTLEAISKSVAVI